MAPAAELLRARGRSSRGTVSIYCNSIGHAYPRGAQRGRAGERLGARPASSHLHDAARAMACQTALQPRCSTAAPLAARGVAPASAAEGHRLAPRRARARAAGRCGARAGRGRARASGAGQAGKSEMDSEMARVLACLPTRVAPPAPHARLRPPRGAIREESYHTPPFAPRITPSFPLARALRRQKRPSRHVSLHVRRGSRWPYGGFGSALAGAAAACWARPLAVGRSVLEAAVLRVAVRNGPPGRAWDRCGGVGGNLAPCLAQTATLGSPLPTRVCARWRERPRNVCRVCLTSRLNEAHVARAPHPAFLLAKSHG